MDNQPTIDQLREAENAGTEYASTAPAAEGTPSAPEAEPVSDAGAESTQTAEAPVAQGESTEQAEPAPAAPAADPYEFLKETPYKDPNELVRGYKELQGQYSKTTEKMRPYKDIIDRMETDFALRTFISQALQGYDNPQLLQAYESHSEPNPANYDLVDPAGQARFMADVKSYNERTIDQRINQRLMAVEQNARLDAAKNEFRVKHPGVDPDEVIKFARDKGQNWSLEDIYKIQNYDRIASEAQTNARKEVTKQLETAQKAKAPAAASTSTANVRTEDVLNDIARYGPQSARKKYGDKKVLAVLQETA